MAMRHTAAGRALPCALRALRAALRAHCGCISANAYRPPAKRAIRHARHTSRTIANGIANGMMATDRLQGRCWRSHSLAIGECQLREKTAAMAAVGDCWP